MPPALPLLLVALLSLGFPGARLDAVLRADAARDSVLDSYRPACGPLPNKEPRAWQLWSRPATWAFMGGKVPGIGASVGANVTIPCGRAVLLDVPRVSLGLLIVNGWLRLLDNPFVPSISVQARFIIVHGRLSVGTETHHFRSRATFTLLPNLRFGRSDFLLQRPAPADPAHPRNLGHKAFAVVGGQVDFHGMPGGASTPAWVRLARWANKGARQITVDADVSGWPRGGVIAVASTTPDLNNAEKAIITGVRRVGPSTSIISLYRPLKHSHDGDMNAVNDGFGGTVDIRAEVALLTRNIVIQGVHEQAPYQYDGGHFMVYKTRTPQVIHGVQFQGLGKQGTLGRYPVHFHMCGDVRRSFFVRKNVILDSKQRCMVVHATSRLTLVDNVAYETRGHCFVLEEGSEARNTFIRNLGMNTRAVHHVIPPESPAKFDRQTDKQPSTFWLATPFNSFIGNVAAGSEDSGFWLEMNKHMRGLSKLLPFYQNLSPVTLAFGLFQGNVIHSNALFGLRTYPHGARPMFPLKGKGRKAVQVHMSHFLIYGNPIGMFFYNSQSITVSRSTFLNNRIAVDLNRNFGMLILGCTFIGRTACSNNSNSPRAASSYAASTQVSTQQPAQASAQEAFAAAASRGATRWSISSWKPLDSAANSESPSSVAPSSVASSSVAPSSVAPTSVAPNSTNNAQAMILPNEYGENNVYSAGVHVEDATNEDELQGYTTSDWQSPGLMLTAPEYTMDDDYSEVAEAATEGVLGRGGKWGWRRRRRAKGGMDGSVYNEDAGEIERPEEEVGRTVAMEVRGRMAAENRAYRDYMASAYNEYGDEDEEEEEDDGYDDEEDAEDGEDGSTGKGVMTEAEEQAAAMKMRGRVAAESIAGNGDVLAYNEDEEDAVKQAAVMKMRERVAAGFFYSRDGGTFKSPIGVMLSQVKLSGMLEANRVVNSRFSGFGECGPTLKSSAIVLAVNKAGGFWNPAMSVQGLRFTTTTRRLYAVPNAPHRPVPRGGANARFYALHDADGSFLSSSSPTFPGAASPAYLVAPFHPILPPASVRTSLCQYHDTWSLYSCRSVCYRAIALTYLEHGVPNLTPKLIKRHRIRPYSTATFTRLTDRSYFVSLGDRNDYSKLYKGSRPVFRTITATLLAGHAYSVEITPPSVNRGFYPRNMTVRVLDKGGCAGGVELRMVPRTRGTQWQTIHMVPQLPCRGKGRNPNLMYQRCTYRNKQPNLALSVGQTYAQYGGESIVLGRMRSPKCPPVKC
ncbi:hypothetical protein CLOP_g14094 [Closterium sp. NIES-67]|nr:hypothetical protein CLOP_g14094 [Closterium sp. NIES-67]